MVNSFFFSKVIALTFKECDPPSLPGSRCFGSSRIPREKINIAHAPRNEIWRTGIVTVCPKQGICQDGRDHCVPVIDSTWFSLPVSIYLPRLRALPMQPRQIRTGRGRQSFRKSTPRQVTMEPLWENLKSTSPSTKTLNDLHCEWIDWRKEREREREYTHNN